MGREKRFRNSISKHQKIKIMNANQLTRVKQIVEEAKILKNELMNEWANEVNQRRGSEILADMNRMQRIMGTLQPIISRESCETDTKKQNTSTGTPEKYTEAEISRDLVTESKRQK